MSLRTQTFLHLDFSDVGTLFILKNSSASVETSQRGFFDLEPGSLAIGSAQFTVPGYPPGNVVLSQGDDSISVSCDCGDKNKGLCVHQSQVLLNVARRDELRLFFDERLRHSRIRETAARYGLDRTVAPDHDFELLQVPGGVEIRPKQPGILPVSGEDNARNREELLVKPIKKDAAEPSAERLLILKKHRYYKQFQAELAEAEFTRAGKLKNPVKLVDPLAQAWKSTEPDLLKFYAAISRFQHNYGDEPAEPELEAVRLLVKNPGNLPVYYHDADAGETLTAATLRKVSLRELSTDLELIIAQRDAFFEIHCHLIIDEKPFDLQELFLRYGCFILHQDTLHFIGDAQVLRVIAWFKKKHENVAIHESRFGEFWSEVLSGLEDRVRITRSYLKPATAEQLSEASFDTAPVKLIYLAESGSTIWITPVMRYGDVEVPVGSLRQLYGTDRNGTPFLVRRDEEAELAFLGRVTRQHPFFKESWENNSFFLHKKRFTEDDWFLHAFEAWTNEAITVLGFEKLSGNKLNPNKAKITIRVMSGLDWFDVWVEVFYGKEKVPLKQLQKSVRNKNRFVKLDDGTEGLLPEEWLERFSKYFQSGELTNEVIRTPKVSFSAIAELYDEAMLTREAKQELDHIRARVGNFETIGQVRPPAGLATPLRDYQQAGLNWLGFLDDFGFGGCLADDMGLGKTIQVIALLLLQKEKNRGTSLVVVPTTLIANWQSELTKFAPSLRVRTFYGDDRLKAGEGFEPSDVVLTSYGRMMSEIGRLKNLYFNYVVLDESQAIKNPDSMRYQAAMMLRSKNRLVLTGTPVENNTFDLYAQLSFACPGLLGDKTYFREIYAIPIDQFGDSKRLIELRKKVAPFILRRTKKQVARELPEKTEMLLYCEMEPAQKEIYETYKREYRDFFKTHLEHELPKHSIHILKGITLLRQICDSPSLLNEGPYYGDSSAKIKVLMEEIEARSGEHKLLVFSQFVGMLDLVRKELDHRGVPYQYLTGQTTRRGEKVNSFRSDPSIRVFLISLKAGGTGLNLVEADYVYLLDPWWNPAVENQAIDRAHRIGQEKPVVAVRMVCPGTIEEKMMIIHNRKKALSSDLVKTDAAMLKTLNREDLEELFS